ncbi:TPA: 2-oxoacid:acceptor oxidoreductase subunit alpha [bacterium]|nr:2-oxoacid:acceptor oxidoreductase subunit alpha [bacterium]
MGSKSKFFDDVSIVLCGEAGQGIQTVEHLMTQTLKLSGYNVFSTQEYMSRIRGGNNSTSIRISSKRVTAPVNRIDILIPFGEGAISHINNRISNDTIIIGEEESFKNEYDGDNSISVPISDIAMEVGGKIYANTVASALLLRLFDVDFELFSNYLKKRFGGKDEQVVQRNIDSAKRGYEVSDKLLKDGKIEIQIKRNPEVEKEIIMDGLEALSLGAIAGGCDFISFYPMSPSTVVAINLAQRSKEFGIVVEQAEDEISAMNMVVGASYAGARALASTSGGGFALMVEAVSLSGMLECPVVIHLGQRPGPATGLPTRTEQGDLNLALYAGHGEFPRAIFAPGTIEDMFYITQNAFNLADKYQIPVFILTDQYILEAHHNITSIEPYRVKPERFIIKTDEDYRRYRITENGVSPRGVPGYGDGLVVVDSDEHDEEGHITESMNVRKMMVNKRFRKLDLVKKDVLSPELIGNPNYKTLVIAWGSNYEVIKEAMDIVGRDDLAFLYFRQVYPIHPSIEEYLNRAEKTAIIENNFTSQFGNLIKLCTGIDIDKKFLKYDGMPFFVEEIAESLKEI